MSINFFPQTSFSLARLLPAVFLALALALAPRAQAQSNIPGPEGSVRFGTEIYALPSGNIVITDPDYNIPNGPQNVGAVYLYNGATGDVISILTGSAENDSVGRSHNPAPGFARDIPGIFVLSNGNFLVRSPSWNQGMGAVTFVDGKTGLSGVVSASNSLVGSTRRSGSSDGRGDNIGVGFGGVTELANGNYVVTSNTWDDGAIVDVGAVTFGSGTTGVSGFVSASNSLVGSATGDLLSARVTKLPNGNYVVSSYQWDNGAAEDAGAVTFGSGTNGVSGVISASNSLVGSTAKDQVGQFGLVTVLTNGNYVVPSPFWANGAAADAGAVTFGNGTTGIAGVVSASNSLVGSGAYDQIGAAPGVFAITALRNGNYVVSSPNWGRVASIDQFGAPFVTEGRGAATFADGTTGITGEVSEANSLTGSRHGDQVGSRGTTALTNGNYVVCSPRWNTEGARLAGAVTFGNGTSGISGAVSASNSLVGASETDAVGSDGITALSNGNYVVLSSAWDNPGPTRGRGAATFGDGTTGVSGVVSDSNSLVGATTRDAVGAGGVTVLSNSNYVVSSPLWDNGTAAQDAGAVTFASGTTGITGAVSVANSLVGSADGDYVGGNDDEDSYITALENGNYVVGSPNWNNGGIEDAGASTFASGSTGLSGPVSSSNSLVGSTAYDQLGGSFDGAVGGVSVTLVTELETGNYIIRTPLWDNGGIADAGAVTFVNGTNGITGEISAANSLVGSTAQDQIGVDRDGGFFLAPTLKRLPNGGYAVGSPRYDNGEIVDAGAITYGDGTNGIVGRITAENSYLGATADAEIGGNYVYDAVNDRFVISRVNENIVTLVRPPGGALLNISTRLRVGTGDNALIGGFIVTGSEAKRVIIRAMGPSLTNQGVAGVLENPTLQLVGAAGETIAFNNDWRDSQQADIEASTIPPGNDLESAIVATLAPGSYTAVVRGANDSTGVGLVEVYDLAQGAPAMLANISTRGFVETGENVMIGGFIVGAGTRVIVRAMGPSLGNQGVAGALQDPTLRLVDANGTEVRGNDNWRSDQQGEIEATGVPPSNDAESALVVTLPAGYYTAIVRGNGETTGVGLVEVYNLR